MHDFSSRSGEFRTRRGKWRFDDDEPTSVKRARRRAPYGFEPAGGGVIGRNTRDLRRYGCDLGVPEVRVALGWV